ncbi:hypothetical protein [Acetobacter estunensis]|uniref:hypothetical protein n=1 Tax=Acetobacter estunensis TaxID=104097 RepID=UPI001C2D3EC1|nr:hypothetical protein [Acetobacter estunensis]MBV1837916.1 hypothetical protein [Acetobacter estunensis]
MAVAITVENFGNMGNRMMQYLFALHLQDHIPGASVYDLEIPEWDIYLPKSSELSIDKTITLTDDFDGNIENIRQSILPFGNTQIDIKGFFQNTNLFIKKESARKIFPDIPSEGLSFPDNSLIINIRCGELVTGAVSWYPLLPIDFYDFIIKESGLSPIFLGQLDYPDYVAQLKAHFPEALYVPSQGALKDFQTLRNAKHICISVSTFSWLAAWLSNSETIYYPLVGFLSPALQKCYEVPIAPTNLTCTDEPRFRYYYMPLFYGEPLEATHSINKRIAHDLRLTSAEMVNVLKRAPFILEPAQNLTDTVGVDNRWYVNTYSIAANEIAMGYYNSPTHHFIQIGKSRGYKPYRNAPEDDQVKLLSLHCPTTQSSISPWSYVQSIEKDSAILVNGQVSQPIFNHTMAEESPSWTIDLGSICQIKEIFIYNRVHEDPIIPERLFPFKIDIKEKDSFKDVTDLFSIQNRGEQILHATAFAPLPGRFLRIRLPGKERILHLRQVQIFGWT